MNSPVKLWRNQKQIARLVGKTGSIVTWTMVYVPPAGFSDQAPYPVAIIELTDKTRITAQLVDYEKDQLTEGQTVKIVIRRVLEPDESGIIPYGIKAKPV